MLTDTQRGPLSIKRTHPSFTADRDRPVDVTVNIKGDIPNRIFTLIGRTTVSIVFRAAVKEERVALSVMCRKFFMATREFDNEEPEVAISCSVVPSLPATIRVVHGRLLTAVGTGPIIMHRLPRVREVKCNNHGGWFVRTDRGLYAWGSNAHGELCIGDRPCGESNTTIRPRHVAVAGKVLKVVPYRYITFILADSGWHASGLNSAGMLGIGNTDVAYTPTPVLNSRSVTRWGVGPGVTFAWGEMGLLASGENRQGQCGVGSEEGSITVLTPVALPDKVKGRVDRVLQTAAGSFIRSGRRCFVVGRNRGFTLGLETADAIRTPVELPFPVDDVISFDNSTVFRSGRTLMVCGDNMSCKLMDAAAATIRAPTALQCPMHVTRVVLGPGWLCFRQSDVWKGRGAIPTVSGDDSDEAELGGLPLGFKLGGSVVARSAALGLDLVTDERRVMRCEGDGCCPP